MQRQHFFFCKNSPHEEVNSQSKMVATTREARRPLLKPVNGFPVAVGSPSSGLFELTGYLYTSDWFISQWREGYLVGTFYICSKPLARCQVSWWLAVPLSAVFPRSLGCPSGGNWNLKTNTAACSKMKWVRSSQKLESRLSYCKKPGVWLSGWR